MTTQRHNHRTQATLRLLLAGLTVLLSSATAGAQRFFNLTADEVRIDSLLPVFSTRIPLGPAFADSTYTITIKYPEFVPMSRADVERYKAITHETPGEMPALEQQLSVERKQGTMGVSLVPLVCRDGKYMKLVSFMLDVEARPKQTAAASRRAATAGRYREQSVLSSGTWVKIRIPETGIYQLTDEFVRQLGFSSLSRVKVHGYGGALQPEKLTADYLAATDDLPEVPTCQVGTRRLFHAVGPVTWDANHRRVRNPYSDYGYYFLTENADEPLMQDEQTFLAANYPSADDQCTLYEVDDYAWLHGGRNLYQAQEITATAGYTCTVPSIGTGTEGTVTVALSGETTMPTPGLPIRIFVNGTQAGTAHITAHGSLEKMRTTTVTYTVDNLQATNEIVISPTGTGTVRLDYVSIYNNQPKPAPSLAQTFPTPAYVHHITTQNHHAAQQADMVIIIPASQKLKAQAERLKTLHEQHDGLRVQIVPADELYNEFSSGTPDANAYRRYLKMLYDRAQSEADMPRYLLLLGDGVWDNRMVLSAWQGETPDDFLLCYESENSYSEVDCYVSDDYFCLLDDDEGGNMLRTDRGDMAVGRISARTAAQAAVAVDKIESYVSNKEAGAWQNIVCFMGDDGNMNQHMQDADSVATMVETLYPNFHVKRVMWDAYTRVSSSTGNSYPDVMRLLKQQMQQGALMMNYSGHGRSDAMSHEFVLKLNDFAATTSQRLPIWVTASCDIMPFDGQEENIGETAMFNKKGGAIAFFGTTRTVYQNYNRLMNLSFTRHVLGMDGTGRPMTVGDAARQAKNELMTTGIWVGRTFDRNTGQYRDVYSGDQTANKLQYSLLGDPALRLAIPTMDMAVDAINDVTLDATNSVMLKAGSTATVTGHVVAPAGGVAQEFNGTVTAVVRDVQEEIVCRRNDVTEADVPFVYHDRPNVLFDGSTVVENGTFTFSFAVPRDIKYSSDHALLNLYAVTNDKTELANGICSQLTLNGTDTDSRNNTGPSIYCYLNNSQFTNGGDVNTTPYFVAELNDEDGINASGNGIGHEMLLVVDGEIAKTYTLNDYFQFDFGSYTRGKVAYSLPALTYGKHRLMFRAWDVLNNSSTTELTFNVVKGLEPVFIDVECSPNPAATQTTFRLVHDRVGSEMDIRLDVMDTSGRLLWSRSETAVSPDNTYTVDWDLTIDGGRRLQTGLYLYRLSISSDGSTYASKSRKLIVISRQ